MVPTKPGTLLIFNDFSQLEKIKQITFLFLKLVWIDLHQGSLYTCASVILFCLEKEISLIVVYDYSNEKFFIQMIKPSGVRVFADKETADAIIKLLSEDLILLLKNNALKITEKK